jgi:hypothetical protein
MIQIDVHPAGKTWYTRHVRFPRQSTYATHMLHVGKGTPNYIPNTVADRSIGPQPFSLFLTTIEVVDKAKYLVATSYIGLLGPYHQHVISTFNTC